MLTQCLFHVWQQQYAFNTQMNPTVAVSDTNILTYALARSSWILKIEVFVMSSNQVFNAPIGDVGLRKNGGLSQHSTALQTWIIKWDRENTSSKRMSVSVLWYGSVLCSSIIVAPEEKEKKSTPKNHGTYQYRSYRLATPLKKIFMSFWATLLNFTFLS